MVKARKYKHKRPKVRGPRRYSAGFSRESLGGAKGRNLYGLKKSKKKAPKHTTVSLRKKK